MTTIVFSDRAARAALSGRFACIPVPAGFDESECSIDLGLADGTVLGSVKVHGYMPVLDGGDAHRVELGAKYPDGYVLHRADVGTLQILDYFDFADCQGCDVVEVDDALALFEWTVGERAARLTAADVRVPFDVAPLRAVAGTARCVPPTEAADDGTERGWNVFATGPDGDEVPLGLGRARHGAQALCEIVNGLHPGELFTDLPLSSSDLLIV